MPKRSHGDSSTAEYHAWKNMRRRCCNPSCSEYPSYGGRGIQVCERWKDSYESFLADMGRRPSPRHSLDRFPDNNGNYNPDNCRWATRKGQSRNTRSTRLFEIQGKSLCMQDLALAAGIHWDTLNYRLKSGWSPDKALSHPIRRDGATSKPITYKGETKPLAVWANEYGLLKSTLRARIDRGWDLDRAFSTPT